MQNEYRRIFCKLLLHCISLEVAKAYNDFGLTVDETTSKHGYPTETFENIKTEDGYLLTLFRISNGKNKTRNVNSKNPVLLMHGMNGSSRDFIQLGPEASLAYLLADRGYDVWLGNARGTHYSRKHVVLDADINPKYWNFSWHEIGVYDLPALIDFIKKVTQQRQISYIGLSQGTTTFYVLASNKSKYNADISLMVSLAPVAFLKHVLSPFLSTVSKYESLLSMLLKLIGVSIFPPPLSSQLLHLIATAFCADTSVGNLIYNPTQIDKVASCSLYADGPHPASIRQILHYGQNIHSGRFVQYNFGEAKNLKIYGARDPPPYNLSKITAPVALFYSIGDIMGQPKDVHNLCDELANCVYKYEIPLYHFSHFHFSQSTDAVPLVYEKVLLLLDEYNEII